MDNLMDSNNIRVNGKLMTNALIDYYCMNTSATYYYTITTHALMDTKSMYQSGNSRAHATLMHGSYLCSLSRTTKSMCEIMTIPSAMRKCNFHHISDIYICHLRP